jgi:hypothetical protein
MRLRKIRTIEEANKFLPKFIEEYNEKFGKEARSKENAHRPMRQEDDLERIFAKRATRKLSKSLSFHYEGTMYQIQPTSANRHRAMHVEILERPGKPILIQNGGKEVAYEKWEGQEGKPKIMDSKELEAYWPSRKQARPGKHHPWRKA